MNNRNASGNSSEADELSLGDLADRIQSEIQEVDLSSLDTAQGKVEEGLQDVIRLTDGLENANLTSIIQLVRSNWHKLKPFLNGAEGLALASGIAQLVAALVLLKSPVQVCKIILIHTKQSQLFSLCFSRHIPERADISRKSGSITISFSALSFSYAHSSLGHSPVLKNPIKWVPFWKN